MLFAAQYIMIPSPIQIPKTSMSQQVNNAANENDDQSICGRISSILSGTIANKTFTETGLPQMAVKAQLKLIFVPQLTMCHVLTQPAMAMTAPMAMYMPILRSH
jgi:hypothetical protein